MRCCFVAEMAHALLVLLIIRLLFIITALQMALLVCLVPALALELLFELLFMELLFALELLFELLLMELLFIIRPGAPDHGAAGNSGFVERQMVTTVFSLFSGTWRR